VVVNTTIPPAPPPAPSVVAGIPPPPLPPPATINTVAGTALVAVKKLVPVAVNRCTIDVPAYNPVEVV
jgi:hypothetical protein